MMADPVWHSAIGAFECASTAKPAATGAVRRMDCGLARRLACRRGIALAPSGASGFRTLAVVTLAMLALAGCYEPGGPGFGLCPRMPLADGMEVSPLGFSSYDVASVLKQRYVVTGEMFTAPYEGPRAFHPSVQQATSATFEVIALYMPDRAVFVGDESIPDHGPCGGAERNEQQHVEFIAVLELRLDGESIFVGEAWLDTTGPPHARARVRFAPTGDFARRAALVYPPDVEVVDQVTVGLEFTGYRDTARVEARMTSDLKDGRWHRLGDFPARSANEL